MLIIPCRTIVTGYYDIMLVFYVSEGAVYLTSPGRLTDIGLQLGKACYPCSG